MAELLDENKDRQYDAEFHYQCLILQVVEMINQLKIKHGWTDEYIRKTADVSKKQYKKFINGSYKVKLLTVCKLSLAFNLYTLIEFNHVNKLSSVEYVKDLEKVLDLDSQFHKDENYNDDIVRQR